MCGRMEGGNVPYDLPTLLQLHNYYAQVTCKNACMFSLSLQKKNIPYMYYFLQCRDCGSFHDFSTVKINTRKLILK